MKFSVAPSLAKRVKADLLILPFYQLEGRAVPAVPLGVVEKDTAAALASGDFKGEESSYLLLYPEGKKEKRILLLGLGDPQKVTVEGLRRTYSAALRTALSKNLTSLNLLLPALKEQPKELVLRGIAEGLLLGNHRQDGGQQKKEAPLIAHVVLIGAGADDLAAARRAEKICAGVLYARELVNGNADLVTPQYLAQEAVRIAKKFPKIRTTVFDKKRIQKEKMGLLLAVNRGSSRDPAFILMEYRGRPASKDHTVIIGKGVTYDTGGLNLKPTGGMETMRCDMGGAAAVFGTIQAIAALGLKVNVTAVVPATENGIDASSYKPGDVYVGYAGKSVEIGNTDAEGRLILADALAYSAAKLKPTRMIDLATLTGAIIVALGSWTTGLMSNQDSLAEDLLHAGNETYERLWRLPLFEEYRKDLNSDVADIKNVSNSGGKSILAALFLQEFVGGIPWAHLDIAGTAFLSQSAFYHPKNGTGVGVRLLVEFFTALQNNFK